MSDYIAWYLVELRTRLAPHLPSTKVESIVLEAGSHLKETTERLKAELQLTDETAALTAIDAFGKPEKVALTHLREIDTRIMGIKPGWLVIGSALLAIWCWDFQWLSLHGPFDNFGETWQNGVAGFVGVLALIFFVVACRAGKRTFRLPLFTMSAALCLGLPLLVSAWMIRTPAHWEGISRLHLSRDVAKINATLDRLKAYEPYFRRGATAYQSAKTESDLPAEFASFQRAQDLLGIPKEDRQHMLLRTDDGYNVAPDALLVPSYAYAMVDGRIGGLEPVRSFAEAKKAWAKNASHSLRAVEHDREGLQSLVAAAGEAQSGRIFFFDPALSVTSVAVTAWFLPVLFILDWAAFASTRRKRVWPVRSLA